MNKSLTAEMVLYRGKKLQPVSFKPLLDTFDMVDELKGAMVRNLDGDAGKVTHMMIATKMGRVFSEGNTPGISFRTFLYGPNIGVANKLTRVSDLDYRFDAFHTKKIPVDVNVFLCAYRHSETNKTDILGLRYFNIVQNMCIDLKCTNETFVGLCTQLHIIAPPAIVEWLNKKLKKVATPVEVVTPVEKAQPAFTLEAPATTRRITAKPKTVAKLDMNINNQQGESQMQVGQEVKLPEGTKPVSMEVNIPIPHTGLSINVKITC